MFFLEFIVTNIPIGHKKQHITKTIIVLVVISFNLHICVSFDDWIIQYVKSIYSISVVNGQKNDVNGNTSQLTIFNPGVNFHMISTSFSWLTTTLSISCSASSLLSVSIFIISFDTCNPRYDVSSWASCSCIYSSYLEHLIINNSNVYYIRTRESRTNSFIFFQFSFILSFFKILLYQFSNLFCSFIIFHFIICIYHKHIF